MRNVADELLYSASTRGVMPWTTFKEAFDALYVAPQSPQALELAHIKRARMRIVRSLDCLGHCDFDFSGQSGQVYAAPPVLARLPHGGFEAVLCGARAPGSAGRLSEAATKVDAHLQLLVEEGGDRLSLAPARILLRCRSAKELEGVAETLGIAFSGIPPAWLLANLAPSLHDYTESLQWQPVEEPNWPLKDFDVRSCSFRNRVGDLDYKATRLTSYRDPRTNQYLTLAWMNDRCAKVDRAWGRYWLIHQVGRRALSYDERRLTLSVSAGAPLPGLYARALTLCSGVPPDTGIADTTDEGAHQETTYRSVPLQIAQTVCDKLGQR